jgi:hypothetical protein
MARIVSRAAAPAGAFGAGRAGEGASRQALTPPEDRVFLFFSNRLGCLGSLALSVGVTVVLLFLLGALR